MKVYTRKGDTGQTSIWGGQRISKDEIRIEAVLARYVNHRAGVPDARWDRHAWRSSRAP